ncbi:MAG: nuclear transport factor 2 family protein [Sphingomonadales bacterium]|nr:nuclear transport factor 2 family protein [Sphingomonadales bacterium]
MLETADIVAIQQLEAFVHHAVDHDDQSWFPLAFTEDAVFDSTACGNGGRRFEGIEAIKGFFALGKPPHPALHHMTNCYVYEQDGQVMVKMKWLVPNLANESFFGGENTDVVVKTAQGWRVKERRAVMKYPQSLLQALGLA